MAPERRGCHVQAAGSRRCPAALTLAAAPLGHLPPVLEVCSLLYSLSMATMSACTTQQAQRAACVRAVAARGCRARGAGHLLPSDRLSGGG